MPRQLILLEIWSLQYLYIELITHMLWLGKIAKLLFYFFSFLDLLHKKEVWESDMPQVSYVTVTSQIIRSYDDHGKVIHRLYSSCISSIENLIRTPSSCHIPEIWQLCNLFLLIILLKL